MNDPHENATWVYNYDRGGNITSKVKYAYTTGTLGTALETIPYTYGDANWKDKLTAYNGTAITYDAIGNPLNDGSWTYEWAVGRQLKKMSRDGQSLTFKYDHNGMRIQKVLEHSWYPETTNYTYHGKLLTHMEVAYTDFDEVGHVGKLHFFYDAQSRPAKVNFNGTTYTYLHNLQGDIVGIIDKSGVLVVEYKYDAWGKLLSTTGSLADTLGVRNPFRYRGYIYDEESGMYYLRSRYFNPAIGRFVNADGVVIPGLLCSNLFAYCSNNPLSRVDTSGYGWHEFWQGVGNWFSNVGKKIGDAIRYDAEIRADVDLRMANNIGNRLSEAVGWLKKTASAVEKWWNDSAKSWIKQAWEDTKEYVGNAYYIQWQSDILSKEMTYNAASKAANWISKNWRGWVANFEKAWSITTWAATGCEIFKLIVIPKSFIIGSWIVEGIFIVYDWIEEKE